MKKWIVRVFLVLLIITTIYYFYPENELPPNTKIDELVVVKSKKTMYAYSKGAWSRSIRSHWEETPIGDKEFQGDKRTPEGKYKINDRNANSTCYKNLGV